MSADPPLPPAGPTSTPQQDPHHPQQAQLFLILTLTGLPVTSQAEARPAPAGPCLVAVGQQADVRAATWLPVLVILTGMTAHWGQRTELSGHQGVCVVFVLVPF